METMIRGVLFFDKRLDFIHFFMAQVIHLMTKTLDKTMVDMIMVVEQTLKDMLVEIMVAVQTEINIVFS
jgi:hypothetical protein